MRSMAEGISIGCDAIHRAITRSHEIENGWPVQQRWNLAKRLVERGMISKAVAEERLALLREIEPQDFIDAIGAEKAKTLGKDAETPAKTHETIASYLEHLIRKIEVETNMIAEMARASAKQEPIDRAELNEVSASLKRSTMAFEFVDILLYRLLVEGREHEAHVVHDEDWMRPDLADRLQHPTEPDRAAL